MNWLKWLPYIACVLAGLFVGQLVQAKLFTKPCPTVERVKCPDCKCPEIKPCPPQIDLSKLDLKKKGKNTVNINIFTVDTTRKK